MGKGYLKVPLKGTIGITNGSLFPVAEEARSIFKRYGISTALTKISDPFMIALNDRLKAGGYRVKIDSKGILLEAESTAAAFHGLQTLLQIATQSPAGKLPLIYVDDWPDFQDRGVYYDVCRGRVPKLERLIEQADLLARYKINHLQLYIEHTFSFRGHPNIGRGASPLTSEDILRLDAHCRDRHIELVPSLASFGHLAPVLKHRQYSHLAEDPNKPWSLSPANPKVYDFLESLFAEFLPCFSSDRFNVCCDETWDLGSGQSRDLCNRRGKGRVYLDHIIKLRRLAMKYGKRIMFWGDIIRNYPDLIKEIPKDVTVLDWGYSHNHDYASIRDFKKADLEFYVCPGTSSWVSLFPRIHEAFANIHGFSKAGKRNGARGLLNTDWGDNGHYNFMEFSWHGYLFGAEQAWNVNADRKSFTERFTRLFLNCGRKDMVRAIETLGEITHLNIIGYYQSIWQYILFAAPDSSLFEGKLQRAWVYRKGKIEQKGISLTPRLGHDTIERLIKVREVLAACASEQGTDPHDVLRYWVFAVDTITCAARKLTVFGKGGTDTRSNRKALKREMTSLMKRFEKLWMARNRRSEIRVTLRRYRKAISAL